MSKLILTTYVSLDGVFEEPGQWSMPFFNDEAGKFKNDELFASDSLLMGRKTYEGFAAAWPTMTGTGDFGERMNNIRKYVVSTTLENPEWTNTRVIKADVVSEIARLKEQPGGDVLLSGSSDLMHSLLPHNLIDEFRIMLHPIVGGGKPLFQEGVDKTVLKLVDTKPLGSGIVILTYLPGTQGG